MLRSSAASSSAPAPADAKAAAAADVPVSTISLDVAPGEDEKEEVLRAMLSVAEAELTAKDVQVDLMRRMLSSSAWISSWISVARRPRRELDRRTSGAVRPAGRPGPSELAR